MGKLGPIYICCDAPPYPIVEACTQLGFQRPADVRWVKVAGGPRPCSVCGQQTVKRERYVFKLLAGTVLHFQLGQCGHCRTISWSDG